MWPSSLARPRPSENYNERDKVSGVQSIARWLHCRANPYRHIEGTRDTWERDKHGHRQHLRESRAVREPVTFVLHRLTDYSDDAILGEIRRVAVAFPDAKFTQTFFEKHSRVARSTILRRFGSWDKAMSRAGLEDRFTGNLFQRLENDEILHALKSLAEKLGKKTLTTREVSKHLGFDATKLFHKRWGSTRAALEAAGLVQSTSGRRYTDEECFDNLLLVWTHYGRPPQYREMGKHPSEVGGKAYVKRFGSWLKALAAFVERVNSDEPAPTTSPLRDNVIANIPQQTNSDDVREYGRDVPLGLRFKVLRRDFFKCVLCGDNPPRNQSCVLHVDHIHPWSKGGKTEEANLRTPCSVCNIGRGNRYTD